MRRRLRPLVVAVAAVVVLGACHADWSQWGVGPARTGENKLESTITTANVGTLHQLWATDLGGFVNAAPVVAADRTTVAGKPADAIFVGTERGDFYGLRADGSIMWSRNLGSHVADCPDTPDNTYGVQASAVYDRLADRVYAMGGAGYLYAMDARTGAVAPGWPVQITGDPVHNAVYSALTLRGSDLFVETASHCDRTPYFGSVTRIDVTTRAKKVWWADGGAGISGGGIWGWGGASVDADGNVYVATGNLVTNPENTPYGDAVVKLSPNLDVLAFHAPGVEIGDDDFGSTPTLFQKPGCPPYLAVEQKNGTVYVYDRSSIASGPVQALWVSQGSDAAHLPIPVDEFIGVPAWSDATQMLYVANPTGTPDGTYTWGMLAFRLDGNCRLVKAWNTQAGTKSYVVGSPSVANNVVYYPAGGARKVFAFNATTGAPLWNSGTTLGGNTYTQPVVVNGRLYVGAYDNKLHAYGL